MAVIEVHLMLAAEHFLLSFYNFSFFKKISQLTMKTKCLHKLYFHRLVANHDFQAEFQATNYMYCLKKDE